jgi:hypothetical protein
MEKLVKPLPKTPQNRKGLLLLFLLCGTISFGIWMSTKKLNFPRSSLGWIQPFKISFIVNQINRDTSRKTQSVLEKVRQILAYDSGIYGIVVYRIEDKVWYGINEDVEFKGASILKIPIMSAAVSAGLDRKYGEYTGRQLVFAMGKYSDNDATTTLADGLGRDIVQAEFENMGMSNSSFNENITTPLDVVQMWKSVYKKPEMWEYLQDSIYEDRLAYGMVPGLQLIHKIGTDDGVWADSGIIQCLAAVAGGVSNCQIRPYIIVILNKETNRQQAQKTVPKIAEIIMSHEAEIARQELSRQASPEMKSE